MSPVCHLLKNSRLYGSLIVALTLCGLLLQGPQLQRTAADSPRAVNNGLSSEASTNNSSQNVAEAQNMFSNSAIRFEINQGQTDRRVKYLARSGSSRFFFTPEEVVFALYQTSNLPKSDTKRLSNHGSKVKVIKMRLSGAKKDPEIVGELETEGHSNYFIGRDQAKWVTDIPTFAQVRYREVYPGIDIIYHGNQKQLQYDFEIAPGANPDPLSISFSGVKGIKVADDGSLQLQTPTGDFRQHAPFAFQEIDGQRVAVDCKYVVRGGDVGFQLGTYDRTRQLIIDPTLVFSTYLGGNGEDRAYDIAIDGSKSVYVTGVTVSTDFPMGVAPIESYNGGMCQSNTYPCFDAFVTKLTPSGQSILYSTYFGGVNNDYGKGITVDALRRAYIVGETWSADFPIPQAQGAGGPGVYKAAKKGANDAFMIELSTLGNEIVYSTFINGHGSGTLSASAEAVAVDILGHVWIAGTTVSIDFPTGSLFGFPLRSSYCKFGGDNGFLIKINPDPVCQDQEEPKCAVSATQPTDPPDFIYGSYVCGSGGSTILDMALDSFGNVWMTGEARGNFPTTLDAFQPAISDPSDINERDAFVAKTDMLGNFMLYASYIGGTSTDVAQSIATDSQGNAYITGSTSSSNFPITPGVVDSSYGGLGEAFVVKFLPSGLPAYSTFVGGQNNVDTAMGIAVDDAGSAYITGNTASTNFPLTPNATQTTHGGGGQGDAYLTKLSPDGSAFQFSTFLGGSGSDFGNAVCVDKAGNAYIAGHTSSTNFPMLNAYDSTFGGGQLAWDGFITKITTEMFVISGRVTDSNNIGFRGVTVTLGGSRSGTTTTDVSGNYSFEVPPNGNYTVTPSLGVLSFTPGNIGYTNLNEDKGAYFSTASPQPSPSVFPVPNLGDALVQDNGAASTVNYGSAPELLDQVKATVGMNRESYLKFDISNFQSATTVKLRLFGRLSSGQSSNIGASVYSVADTSWDEKTITWNSKPASGGSALATTTVTDTTARWYEWDVTSYVNAERAAGHPVASFVLKNDTSSIAVTRFNSREAGENFPRLEVTSPTSGSLPAPWSQSGVPSTLTTGSTDYVSGIFTISGAGTGFAIGATADQFHSVHQQVSGNFRLVARVPSMENFDANSMAGIQVRANLQADSPHATLLLEPGQSIAELRSRTTSGGSNDTAVGSGKEWLMLHRNGNDLTAFTSDDGTNWKQVGGTVTLSGVSDPVYVGMVVASGSSGNLSRARFSNVAITAGTQNSPPQVEIVFPKTGATHNPSTNIQFSATATDTGGTITNVEFLSGTTVLGTASLSGGTYNYTWPSANVVAGIYSISARATDNGGATTTSAPITIAVNPVGAATLNPTDDAFVTNTASNTNFGTDRLLAVEDGALDTWVSYVKFDTSAVSDVTRATLRLYDESIGPAPTISVYAVADTTWTEGTINWSNRPTVGLLLRQSDAGRGLSFFTWDITDYVLSQKTGGNHVISLAIQGEFQEARVDFTSKEATNGARPELLLTTTAYHGRVAYGQPYPDNSDTLYPLLASYLRRYDAAPWLDPLTATTTEKPVVQFQGGRSNSPRQNYVADELLIQYEDGASEDAKAQARSRVGGQIKEKIKSRMRRATEHGAEAGELELVKLPRGRDAINAADFLRRQPGVRFAEPNLIYETASVPDEPNFANGTLWNMYGPTSGPSPSPSPSPFGSNAAAAWQTGHTGATTVYVAILDGGVQIEHPDLRRNAWTNSLDPPDGVDNDRNGFTDDTYGWDFVNGDNTIYDDPLFDQHGTHITGPIAAVGNNATGIVGVGWRTTFIPVKVLQNGGTLANYIKGLDYVTDLKIRHGINIVAINNSLTSRVFSQALLEAIARSAKANILFVAAAGNGGSDDRSDDNDLVPVYPASYDTSILAGYDSVISVTAIASDGSLAAFANYGPTSVDLGAPGVGILSTIPNNSYGIGEGTSAAVPHVSGAIALYASMYRVASPVKIREVVLDSARDTATPSLTGLTVTGGRLNIGSWGQ